eukprot:3404540-Prorocentrum_lima.AAC.1
MWSGLGRSFAQCGVKNCLLGRKYLSGVGAVARAKLVGKPSRSWGGEELHKRAKCVGSPRLLDLTIVTSSPGEEYSFGAGAVHARRD